MIIKPNAPLELCTQYPSMDFLHKAIENYFDVIQITDTIDLFVDDEGLINGQDISLILKRNKSTYLVEPEDIAIRGNCVFCHREGEKTHTLTPEEVDYLVARLEILVAVKHQQEQSIYLLKLYE